MGYLSCTHVDSEEQQENFWHLVNPQLDDTVNISKVVDLLVSFIEVAIDMRIEIETKCGLDPDILAYLRKVDGKEKRDLAAQLLDFKTEEELLATHQDLTQDDLFDIVNEDNCMFTHSIRMKLLEKADEAEEEGVNFS